MYVDDTLFFARDKEDIEEIIDKIEYNSNLKRTVKNNVAGYLRVLINPNKEGEITLTQLYLIEEIIFALDLGDAHAKGTPESFRTPFKDKDGSLS